MAGSTSSSGLTPREIAQQHREQELKKERSRRAIIGGVIIAAVIGLIALVASMFKKNAASTTATSKGPAPATGNQYGGVTLTKDGLRKVGGVTVDADTVGPAAKEISTNPPSGATTTSKSEPGQVILYLDMACPHCAAFEGTYGEKLKSMVDSNKITIEYRIISILDMTANKNYSTRAGGAMMSVADQYPDKFYVSLFKMFENQPNEAVGATNDQIKKVLKDAGVPSGIDKMVDDGSFRHYTKFTNALAAHEGIGGTPTVFVESERWNATTDTDFIKFVEEKLAARK